MNFIDKFVNIKIIGTILLNNFDIQTPCYLI